VVDDALERALEAAVKRKQRMLKVRSSATQSLPPISSQQLNMMYIQSVSLSNQNHRTLSVLLMVITGDLVVNALAVGRSN
jgi:hypothetical protein